MARHDCTDHLPSRHLARLGVEHTCGRCGKRWVLGLSRPNRNREWQRKVRVTLW